MEQNEIEISKVGASWFMNDRYCQWRAIENADARAVSYRGWRIVHVEEDFGHYYDVYDNNGWKVAPDRIELRTLRQAVNMIDRYFAAREGMSL